jgi:hypothetical protein
MEIKSKSKKNSVAFDFVVEQLFSISPIVKPMFGCHALYLKDKILLVLRNRQTETQDNGIWIATTPDHHQSLAADFPSLRNIFVLGSSQSSWRNLPADDDNFESDAIKVCQLILKGDVRIGKLPKTKRKKVANDKR